MDTIDISIGGLFMRTFTKVFIVSFFCFFVALYIGAVSYLRTNDIDINENLGFGFYEKEDLTKVILNKLETKPKEEKIFSTMADALENSSRVNFLIMGMEGVRTDSLLLASFNRDTKKIDIISIPRDTYVHRKGYNAGDLRKINAVYYSHGVEGIKKTVSYILDDIPIHHYIMVDYEAVEELVDIAGGVEVDVPFDMKYSDPTAKPPLEIDIKKGHQILDGKNALNYMRWRKSNNNKKGYIDGDIGRIKAQQQLLTSLADKSSNNIIQIITRGFKYIKTDMGLFDLMSYGRSAIGIKKDDIKFITLPGKSDIRSINKQVYSYYVYNQNDITKILEEIYNVKKES